MNHELSQHMEQGFAYLEEEDFEAALASFTKALEYGPGNAEAWHFGALALIELKRAEDAQDYLGHALRNYDKRIQLDESLAYNFFQKASLYAVLHQKNAMIEALEASFKNDLNYAEDAAESALFEPFDQDADFSKLLEESLEKLDTLRYRGEELSLEDLTKAQLEERANFVQMLQNQGWEVEEWEEQFAEGQALSPQAQGEWYPNENFGVRLGYHMDEHLFFLEMKNFESDEHQSFRLYYKKKPQRLLEAILADQAKIPHTPGLLFVKKFIPLCREVFYEMPNGTRMKLSKF